MNQKNYPTFGTFQLHPEEMVTERSFRSSFQEDVFPYPQEGDLVLDPFIGSGTTAAVAIKLNRKYIGFDICEEYLETATKKIETARNGLLS